MRSDPPRPAASTSRFRLHADGRREELPGCFQGLVNAGDAIKIHTPGGGGFGSPMAAGPVGRMIRPTTADSSPRSRRSACWCPAWH
ncbi:MAG: hydantoinase B/oxoprolinase family protein [Magnetococcales bacterium]|nr:hydantoinase B/oxoprolinase family protein [Magnetococcales bacterium]